MNPLDTNASESVGRLVSRRDVITIVGVTGTAWLLMGRLSRTHGFAESDGLSCIVRPEQTEGPYFVDERLHRSDIRSDPTDGQVKRGIPLVLIPRVFRLGPRRCDPLPEAQVDIWHCDAQGVYSDVRDPYFNTNGRKFLRGYQITDAKGNARFTTIYPGWYPGRTVHIHFKIRTQLISRQSFDFTSQWYFSDELTDHVHAAPPYAERGPRMVRNRHDRIFWRGGSQLMLAPSKTSDGYEAAFSIGLEMP